MDRDRPCSSTDSPRRLQKCRLGEPPFSCSVWESCRLVLYAVGFVLESILMSQAGVWAARKRGWTSQELPSSLRTGDCEINAAASSSLPVVILRCAQGSSRGSSGRWAPGAYGGNLLTRVVFFVFLPFLPSTLGASWDPFPHKNTNALTCLFQNLLLGRQTPRQFPWYSKCQQWDFPGAPMAKTLRFQCRGHEFECLVRELRSHMT